MSSKRQDRTSATYKSGKESVYLQMDSLWRPVFDKYDTNGDGKIELDEFKQMLRRGNSELNIDIPEDVLEEIVERADWDKNRVLSYDEFVRMVSMHELGAQRPRVHRLLRYAALAVVPKSQRQSTIRRYLEEYNCRPPPLFLLIVSIIEVAIFIYYCIVENEISFTGPIPFCSPLIYDPYRRQQVWRFLTYMLIHAGIMHIFFNILIQLILGIPLEMVHKWWRVGLVYLGGVIAGSLGASVTDPQMFLAGASGGVYALIAAHLANVVINWSEMEFGVVRLIALLIFGGLDIGVAIYDRVADPASQNKTSYAAHFAGALAGLLLGINCLRNLKVRRWEIVLGWFALSIYLLFMGFMIVWNIAYTSHFPDMRAGFPSPDDCAKLSRH